MGCNFDTKKETAADSVFTNGKIYTVNEAQPWAEAIAFIDDKIVFVGSNEEAKAFIGDQTEVIDAGGRLILPGLIDTHCHLRIAGQANSVMLNLFESMTESPEVVKEIIRKHAETLGPDDWVLGTGWGAAQFPNPTKEELDELTGGRPAILADDSQHNGWYSTKALEYFGITNDTPNPKGGIIKRDAKGEATGFMVEKAHISLGFAEVLNGRAFEGDEMLNLRTVKWAIDGIPGTMAFMSEPYKDGTHPPANYTQERLNQEVDKYTELGFRMMFHAEGDAGIDRTLQALEYANETGKPLDPNDRHIITHLDHGNTGHFERMKKLNIIAQIQFHWAAPNDYNRNTVFTNVKKDLVDKMYDFRGMYDAGLHVAAGAYTMFREDILGSLEVGKKADLIVLDRDVFEVAKNNPMDVHKTKVVLTLMNGEVVWGGANFEKTVEGSSKTVEYGDYGKKEHVCLSGIWQVKEK